MNIVDRLKSTVPRGTMDLFENLVSRETFEKFVFYKELLEKWQKNLNLVSNKSLEVFWRRHLFDSLQLVQYIPNESSVLDVGSGGGFPGAVLAITGQYHVTCLDSDFKKCCFLRELFGSLKIHADVITDRIENISNVSHHFDIITARGFSEVVDLLSIVERFSATGVFLKGKNVESELRIAQEYFSFQYELNKSVTSSDGFVLVVRECRRK